MSVSLSAVPFCPCPAGPVGSAFNAVNPRMDSIASGRQNSPNCQPVEILQSHCGSDADFLPKPWQLQPICGLVTLDNIDWTPAKVTDVPPSPTKGMGLEVSAQFALAFNQSARSRSKNRWAVVSTRGTVLILCGVTLADRPLNPSDFPPCVERNLSFHEAESRALEANRERFRIARIPRQWTVSLFRPDSVEAGRNGVE